MRTLSAALIAKQKVASVVPYVKFKLTSADGGTTYDYPTRVLTLEHHEEPYNEFATVVLDNHDRDVADDLRGYWVQVAYGYITGNAVADVEGAESAGNNSTAEYSYTPRLWVKSQQELTSPGNVKTILELEGMWNVLREIQWVSAADGPPSFYFNEYTTDTVMAIISSLLGDIGFSLDAIGTQSDGIIDVDTPIFQINGADAVEVFDDYATIIYRLLTITKCYLRSKTGLAFKIIYPQVADAVDETYYSDKQYIFSEYLERKKLLIPNHIYVLWGDPGGGLGWPYWDWTAGHAGEAADTTEIAMYKDCAGVITAGELTTEAAADVRASAKLTRLKSEQLGGHLVTRHDCGVELYDRVEIEDKRGI